MSKRAKAAAPADPLARAKFLREAAQKAVREFLAYSNPNLAPSRHRKGGWQTPGVAERDMPRFDRERALEYSREFVETQPIAAAIIQNMTDAVIGRGFRLKMATPDEGWNREVEARWRDARDKLDIRGLRSWRELTAVWFARQKIDGDVGIEMKPVDKTSYLRTVEADRIRAKPFAYLDQGVEYDPETGRPLAYWVAPRPKDQQDWSKVLADGKKIDARDFVLYANWGAQNRTDQLRGFPVLLQNFNLFRDIAEVLDAVVQKMKLEAFAALVTYTEAGYGMSSFGDAEEVKTDGDGKKRRVLKMVPAHVLDLQPGERMEMLGLKTPNAEFVPMIRFLLRYSGALVGMPLELMLMDVSETNFSGGRLLIELAKRRQHVEQDGLATVCTRLFQWWLAREVKYGGLRVPKKIEGAHWRHRWGKPSMPYYDPGREADAYGKLIDRGLASPAGILAENSDMDEDEVLASIAAHVTKRHDLGLPMIWGNVSTSIAEQPGKEAPPKAAEPEEPEEE